MTLLIALTAAASALALISLGGGFYEASVIDPAWPKRPELIQPSRGGISRKHFWIPAHVAFELLLLATLAAAWAQPGVRTPLLIALGSHATMRAWSAFDFIPKALAFERAPPASITESMARRWTCRSRWRFALDAVTCSATLAALVSAARVA